MRDASKAGVVALTLAAEALSMSHSDAGDQSMSLSPFNGRPTIHRQLLPQMELEAAAGAPGLECTARSDLGVITIAHISKFLRSAMDEQFFAVAFH